VDDVIAACLAVVLSDQRPALRSGKGAARFGSRPGINPRHPAPGGSAPSSYARHHPARCGYRARSARRQLHDGLNSRNRPRFCEIGAD
jgi:hypothetical protein